MSIENKSLPNLSNHRTYHQYLNFNVNKDVANAIAGSGAGLIAAIVTCPLDVVRTVHQVQRTESKGVLATMNQIIKADGAKGLFRGLSALMMALVPSHVIYFVAYNKFKSTLVGHGFQEGTSTHVLAAMSAGIFNDVITNPLWMLKTRIQTQTIGGKPKIYNSTLHAAKTIYYKEGPRAFMSGLSAQMLAVCHVGIQFPLYERFKIYFADKGQKEKKNLSVSELMISSSTSKLIATCAAYPHEVIRSRLQHQKSTDADRYKGLVDAAKRIYLEEGIRGYYRGLWASALRVTPTCAISFTLFEIIVRALTNGP